MLRATTPCTFSTSQLPNVLRTHQFLTLFTSNVLRATTPCTFSSSQLPKVLRTHQFLTHFTSKCASRQNAVHFFKVLRTHQFLTLFTSKCASRHNAVHFFVISTSKSAPNPSVFNTFYFQMCFAPQRRALFQHLNFQKCSEPISF